MNCTSDDIYDCQYRNFRLKAFEWNLEVIKSNLQNHIIDISNTNSFDWRDIIYDTYFFEGLFTSVSKIFIFIKLYHLMR